MSTKRDLITTLADKRLKRTDFILRTSLYVLCAIVLYDSIVHDLPFHYIFFLIFGHYLGKVFTFSHHIEFDVEDPELELRTNRLSIFFMILLLLTRFAIGPYILDLLQFVYVSDALILVFIGVKNTKWRLLVNQIDEIVYRYAGKSAKVDKRDD